MTLQWISLLFSACKMDRQDLYSANNHFCGILILKLETCDTIWIILENSLRPGIYIKTYIRSHLDRNINWKSQSKPWYTSYFNMGICESNNFFRCGKKNGEILNWLVFKVLWNVTQKHKAVFNLLLYVDFS